MDENQAPPQSRQDDLIPKENTGDSTAMTPGSTDPATEKPAREKSVATEAAPQRTGSKKSRRLKSAPTDATTLDGPGTDEALKKIYRDRIGAAVAKVGAAAGWNLPDKVVDAVAGKLCLSVEAHVKTVLPDLVRHAILVSFGGSRLTRKPRRKRSS